MKKKIYCTNCLFWNVTESIFFSQSDEEYYSECIKTVPHETYRGIETRTLEGNRDNYENNCKYFNQK